MERHNKKSARYSTTFQAIEEYLPARALISNTATRNQDQCKNTSMPANRNRRIDPRRLIGIYEIYNTGLFNNNAVGNAIFKGQPHFVGMSTAGSRLSSFNRFGCSIRRNSGLTATPAPTRHTYIPTWPCRRTGRGLVTNSVPPASNVMRTSRESPHNSVAKSRRLYNLYLAC